MKREELLAIAKPIIFCTDMVQAIMDGRKTMTRRIITPQPEGDWMGWINSSTDKTYIGMAAWGSDDIGLCADKRRPRYKVGDILYIRETWAPGCMGGYIYKAGHEYAERLTELKQWKPSIHMPKAAARTFIEITALKAERLQEITEEDAIREGITRGYDHLSDTEYEQWANSVVPGMKKSDWGWTNYLWHGNYGKYGMGSKQTDAWAYQGSMYDDPRGSFSSLWEVLNTKRGHGWEKNDWVFAYTFRRIEAED